MEKTWEYNRMDLEFSNTNELITELNKHGANGWEIISYAETKPKKFGDKFKTIVLFKREPTC